MKKIFFIIFLASLFTACDKQLQENPRNRITTDNFYTSDNEAILGVNGVYSWLGTSGGFKSSLWRALDEGTDVIRVRNRPTDPEPNYTMSSFSPGYTLAIWTNLYKGISNANLVIVLEVQVQDPSVQIAPLLFIPFIENAFKYGSGSDERHNIRIVIRQTISHLQLVVSNYITKPVDVDQLLSLLRVWLYEKN